MFKKSNKATQLDAFSNVSNMLDTSAHKQYNDKGHWHNQFREQVLMRIEESLFSVLFHGTTGAPNAPIRTLIGMMILKDAFGWSDSQLYEHQRQTEEDLMEKVFETITMGQVKDFEVNGRSIRMDSKLIGSNIAIFTRYEIIHKALCLFYKSLSKSAKSRLSKNDREQLESLVEEESEKTVYRSTKEDLNNRLQTIGTLAYKMVKLYGNMRTDKFELLKRIFNEQYEISEDKKVILRPKEEISSSSVQSPMVATKVPLMMNIARILIWFLPGCRVLEQDLI